MKKTNTTSTTSTKNSTTKLLESCICKNHTGKMEDMQSISTSVLFNPDCAKRAKNPKSVCYYCFASRMMQRYRTLEKKLARNTEILTSTIYSPEYFPVVNASFFCFESFGDLINYIQVMNYFNMCIRNPKTSFALWTKNPHIIQEALDRGAKKPKNLVIVYSSPALNHRADNMPKLYPFIDKVFTVWTKDGAERAGITVNCGARHCLTCGRCYSKRTAVFVDELLK